MASADDLLPAFLIAEELGVSPQLVRSWVVAGRLQPAEERNGRKLYRVRDAAVADRDAKASPYSHRSTAAA